MSTFRLGILVLLLFASLVAGGQPAQAQIFYEEPPDFYDVPIYDPPQGLNPMGPGSYCALCVPNSVDGAVDRHFKRQERFSSPSYDPTYGAGAYMRPVPMSPPTTHYRHSLQDNPASLPEWDDRQIEEDRFREEQRSHMKAQQQHWLHQLYQNQKPVACGPAFDPRAREGC